MSFSTRGRESRLTVYCETWNNPVFAHSPPHTLQSSFQRRQFVVRSGISWRITINCSSRASVWDDVSEPSCWRYCRGSEAHTLAVCWQTQVMFWTRPWINMGFCCCCENSLLLQPRQHGHGALTLALDGLSLRVTVALTRSLSWPNLEKKYKINQIKSKGLNKNISVAQITFNVHFTFCLVFNFV